MPSIKEVPPEISLRFVAFVNEELPFFFWPGMGSMVYAKGAKQRGDPIRFMISLETIKAFMIINAAFYRYPYYHTPQYAR